MSPAGVDTEESGKRLTPREMQILKLMAEGLTDRQIGTKLFLSVDTVKSHVKHLYRVMGAANRAHAVAKGFRWGYLT